MGDNFYQGLVFFVDEERVNMRHMEYLMKRLDGCAVVRVIGDPHTAVKIMLPPEMSPLECVAGWISEDA